VKVFVPSPVVTTEVDGAGGAGSTRFPVDVPGFRGSLDELVARAHRGEVDLESVPLAEITGGYRARLDEAGAVDLSEVADFLTLSARLVALKAARLNPQQQQEEADEPEPETDAGRRLAEYRLFKAAADALLAEAAEEGTRSFLGLVVPDVLPVERLRIPPERLAAAFRDVLERLADTEQLSLGGVTFSVEEKVAELRARLLGGRMRFTEVFRSVASRLEAVACFLALLELLRLGEAVVEQEGTYGVIWVDRGG